MSASLSVVDVRLILEQAISLQSTVGLEGSERDLVVIHGDARWGLGTWQISKHVSTERAAESRAALIDALASVIVEGLADVQTRERIRERQIERAWA